MASAVFAQNEPDWTQNRPGGGRNFTGKVPFSRSNPNPKPNNKVTKHKKRQIHQVDVDEMDESQVLAQSAASDDASSINRKPSHDFSCSAYVSFNVASCSKKERFELKKRMISELEQVRQVQNRIESHASAIRSSSNHLPVKKCGGASKTIGNKRPFPSSFSKESKKPSYIHGNSMKACGQILTKLMKHQYGYVFNSPVDVVGLGLHDYYQVIKYPMDLGTVKSKLAKNVYDSPFDFASDVRLTFNNAMKYNPKGHEIYNLADQLLSRFEDLFVPLNVKFREDEEREEEVVFGEELQASSWSQPVLEQSRAKRDSHSRDNSMNIEIKPQESNVQAVRSSSYRTPDPPVVVQQQIQQKEQSPIQVQTRVKQLKQPKPKAKDTNKRDMTLEEKHKLGMSLQNLPSEKMENVVQIIRKRNEGLTQDGDEIELDIEAVDVETLWELDRFITYYKKMVSKIRRQALMGIQNVASSDGGRMEMPVIERIEMGSDVRKGRKGEGGEEDVDIGDEMPVSSFPPVEIDKDNGHASSSSSTSGSSGSDSSSSSDSESGSSSGSDSDAADDAGS